MVLLKDNKLQDKSLGRVIDERLTRHWKMDDFNSVREQHSLNSLII